MIALWLLASCDRQPVEPELEASKTALEAWERGSRSLEAGDPAAARAAFAEARAVREGPVLAAWEGAAAAEAGDLEGAISAYRAALEADPAFAAARYRLGVLLARAGRVAEGATELRLAVEGGAARTMELLEDPELAPFLDDPAFAFVPREPLGAAVDPVPPTAFWGSEVEVVVRLVGLVRPPFRVVSGAAEGPVRLVGVRQEDVSTSQGPGQEVRFRLRVVGAGRATVGPIELEAGRFRATAPAVGFDAAAPPGKEGSAEAPVPLLLPDQLLERLSSPGAAWWGEELAVAADDQDRVSLEPQAGPPARRFDRRTADGRATWIQVWDGPLSPETRVAIRRAGSGEVRFDGPPAR